MTSAGYAHTASTSPKAAAAELRAAMPGTYKLVLFFSSSNYDGAELAREMARAFGGAPTLGCSTSGELTSGAMLKQTVVAMGLTSDVVSDVAVALAPAVNVPGSVSRALNHLAAHFNETPGTLDPERFVGLVLTDGLSVAEESANEQLTPQTNGSFVGGWVRGR